ncbi:DUF4190 domain-containing protein [Agromyces mangrovi Wang et al. 2018]|uniref:DUF4190 domain-containing protein n=1 Tax=Agromyces mangrovi TaxID=1858653 RepID=UPI0025744C4A|nr:DUF4190 domain-containing protein [Agromyces mangrovi]BDZ64962.1 hypothetical protein GCM10025877_19000 [Agromyces mangrovi]
MTTPSPTPAPANESWNVWAIVAFVTVWFTGILGLVFGYVGLSQIKRTGERGRGLALAAVILGWIGVAIGLLILVIVLVSGGLIIANS